MSIPESLIEKTPAGSVPAGEGWFVLNLIGARGFETPGHGVFCPFEAPDARFPEYGINVHVLQPGERSTLYHHEEAQEDFLVLAGACLAVIEEQERALRQWDFVHCPAGTAHAFIGAGDGPCAILMTGSRQHDGATRYPVSETATRHGVSVPVPTEGARDAYDRAGWSRHTAAVPMPWPGG